MFKHILLFPILVIPISFFIAKIELNKNCIGYLKRAADASTIEIASKQLEKAISYCESEGYTSGYTSVFIRTPDDDIGFWYDNLVSAQKELLSVDTTTTSIEKTNLLMKLRETILDGGSQTKVTVPNFLYFYPYNKVWAALLLVFTSCVISYYISISKNY